MRLSPLNDNGTAGFTFSGRVTVMEFFDRSTPAPMARRMPAVMSTSPTSGMLVIVLGPVPSMAATMCLVTAFFEPRTSTVPRRGPLGSINQESDTLQRLLPAGPGLADTPAGLNAGRGRNKPGL